MKATIGCAVLASLLFLATPSSAQFLNKLKQKAENKLEKEIDKKLDPSQPNQNQGQGNGGAGGSNNGSSGGGGGTTGGGGNSGGGLSQNQGGGLVSTPPDVKANLTDAESAYKGGKYGEARYSLQQAMLGVELEIGNKILKSLPETISGLNKDATADQVTSTGSGWAGLTIVRKYTDGKNKDFRTTIANNAVWMSAINMYMNSGGYAQQTGGEQNWKQTKVKGNRAIIEFSQSSGYKLSVPIGQSSLIVFEGVSFASESDMMAAANSVDIDGIKKMLGEQ
jgi:hypothetical protein